MAAWEYWNADMTTRTRPYYEARAKIAKALAHASRLMILELLRGQEMCVNELTDAIGTDQSTISKHLTVLKEAGLIALRKKGQMNFYRVTTGGAVDRFFSSMEAVLKYNLKSSEDAV